MKILSLNFKNINSLQGEHHIDFTSEDFVQNPLFAITGPTGSGKTTILDVITLALFGRIPRLGKIYKSDVEEKGAVLTKNQKDCFAQVIYECEKGIYSSIWRIEINRNGNLNDYEMEINRIDLPESLDLSKTQVPEKNEKLIGLNYEQFVKSVLLAQGEFAEFLKAKRKERSELLEKITGTGIYRKLGQLAFEKFRDKNKVIENEIHVLESEKEKLLEKEEKQKTQQELKALLKIKAENQIQLEFLKKQKDLKIEFEKINQLLEKKKKELENLKNQYQEFVDENGKILENHENIQRFSADLYQWKTKQKELENLKIEKQKFFGQKQELEKNKNRVFQEIQQFLNIEVVEKQVIEKLQIFKEKIDFLEKQRSELGAKFRTKRAEFITELKEFEFGNLKEIVNNELLWKEILENHEKEKLKLKQLFKDDFPKNIVEKIEDKENEIQALIKAESEQKYILKSKKEFSEKEINLEKLENQIKPLPKLIQDLESQLKLSSEELKNLKAEEKIRFLEGELENYRKELKFGEACFLCGSTNHPYAENLPEQKDELKTEIENKEKEVKKLADQFSQTKTRFEELKKQIKNFNKELELKTKELKDLKTNFKKNYLGKFDFTEKNWEEKQRKLKTEIKNLKEYEVFKKLDSSLENTIPLYDEMQKIIQQGKAKGEEIKALYKGENIEKEVNEFQNNWRDLSLKLENIEERIKEIKLKNKQEKENYLKIEKALLPALNELGFSEISSAEKALLPTEKYEDLKKQKSDFEKQISSFKTEIKTHQTTAKEFEGKIKIQKEKTALNQEIEDLENHQKTLQNQEEEFKRKIKNDDDLIKAIVEREKNIANAQKQMLRWKLLKDLIGDANGHKFNQFAQDLTLRQLLILANKRLGEINKRYQLVFNFNSDKNQDNLVIADMDMGGQERAVQTLSGGESFLVSLALALGLSDLASKKININSLFIDEGFGTLDGSTLDQTLDVLERLQASSSKIIGIISHVDSLKERIGTQIELQKNGQGYSSLKITSL